MPTLTIKIEEISQEEFTNLDMAIRYVLRLATIKANVTGNYNDKED